MVTKTKRNNLRRKGYVASIVKAASQATLAIYLCFTVVSLINQA